MSSSTPVDFPGSSVQLATINNSGSLVANSSIQESSVLVLPEDATEGTLVSAYTRDASSQSEAMRQSMLVEDGETTLSISLGSTNLTSMDETLTLSPVNTTVSSFENGETNSAIFGVEGLKWSNSDSALYLGGDIFRIKLGALTSGEDTLAIQSLSTDGTEYITKFEIVRDA
jgi:hypothetical protein